ncbi:hypothetical protein XvhCFBP2543_17870 [Xanthomonas vasicola]|uniref:Uncharacterized protein n=1 Tax=Xanthomonas vasicola TaxID=56459 RepID=A0ABD7S7I1_XANVA|nr:hypothetical protein NX81_000285 [Xanthomonas vasicola]PPV01294.1 hypothetical protein XvhCFBP2543_17870 [Xanthomonas vasicola]TWQ26403.1 hypothetical protein FQJ97_00295 [Xanthomonas vasicola]TWQ38778.1 hypothetical protein FQJ96_11555 [Xanthomonas vasicola]TWQ50702.1 hypothetical protein FQK01_17545 [Xanthomonas vasicola]
MPCLASDWRAPPCAQELTEQALELSKMLASDFGYLRSPTHSIGGTPAWLAVRVSRPELRAVA